MGPMPTPVRIRNPHGPCFREHWIPRSPAGTSCSRPVLAASTTHSRQTARSPSCSDPDMRRGAQGAGFIRACDPVHASAIAVWRSSARISLWAVEFRHAVTHNLVHQQRAQGGLMIELEIQALSERREGLLIEVGRMAVANGFTLQRQRLIQDPHGILLTIVVRGPPRKKRALEAALQAYDRIISF